MSTIVWQCTGCDAEGAAEGEGIPPSWQWFDNGARLLCGRCCCARRSGDMRQYPELDPARLGLLETSVPRPRAQRQCDGCKRTVSLAGDWSESDGKHFCSSCSAKRRNPRLYQPAELREAGIDPNAVLAGEWRS